MLLSLQCPLDDYWWWRCWSNPIALHQLGPRCVVSLRATRSKAVHIVMDVHSRATSGIKSVLFQPNVFFGSSQLQWFVIWFGYNLFGLADQVDKWCWVCGHQRADAADKHSGFLSMAKLYWVSKVVTFNMNDHEWVPQNGFYTSKTQDQ